MRGIVDRFLAEGRQVPAWHLGMLPTKLDYSRLDTRFPFMLALPQLRTEEILLDRATSSGVTVAPGCELTGLTSMGDTVAAEVRADGAVSTLTADFVVGCDGARSAVRTAAGIGFDGAATTAWGFVADLDLADPPAPGFSVNSEQGALIVTRSPVGTYRIAGWDPLHQSADEPLTLADLQEHAIRLTGSDFGMHSPTWLSRFGNANRLAATYRSGRVLLAGDAAHIHWPTGGVGMNVGIQDAMNLGWRLGAVVRRQLPIEALDDYTAERRPVGESLRALTLAQEALITSTSPQERALRDLVDGAIATPELNRAMAARVTALDTAYHRPGDVDHLIGAAVPQRGGAGADELFAAMGAGLPVLVTAMSADSEVVRSAELRGASIVLRHPGTVLGTIGWDDVEAALVRPDGHVAWIARSGGDATDLDLDLDLNRALTRVGR